MTWAEIMADPDAAAEWASGKTVVVGHTTALRLFGSCDPDDPWRIPDRAVFDENEDRFFLSNYLPAGVLYFVDDEQLADLKESLAEYEREHSPMRHFINAATEPHPITTAELEAAMEEAWRAVGSDG